MKNTRLERLEQHIAPIYDFPLSVLYVGGGKYRIDSPGYDRQIVTGEELDEITSERQVHPGVPNCLIFADEGEQ